VKEGHEVEVICGTSRYASVGQADEPPAVKIHRVPCLPYTRSRFARSFSYLSFLAGCLWKGLTVSKPDLIVTMTTPPVLSAIGAILQRRHSTRHVIWAMDLFPETLVDVGVLQPKSKIVWLLNRIADQVYAKADGIIAIGDCMRQRLIRRNVPEEKLLVVENWADGKNIFPIADPQKGPFVVLYSGNLGLSHDIDTIRFALQRLRSDDGFNFRFAGDGPRYRELRQDLSAQDVPNVDFLPYRSKSELAERLSQANIGLVTQRSTCFGSVVPSKMYSLMAAGKPILYIGPRDTTPHHILQKYQCGWQIDCGDGEGLVSLLQYLRENREVLTSAGNRAREAFLADYDLPQGVARFCRSIGALECAREEAMHVA